MKHSIFIGSLVLLIALSGCTEKKFNLAEAKESKIKTDGLVDRGKYLVLVMDCIACHTPKKMSEQGPIPDMDRYMMGFDSSSNLSQPPKNVPLGPWVLFNGELTAAIGPWGTSFAANLTPHKTGIGAWSIEQFKKAMTEGKYKGHENTRPLMPPMPVEAYKNLTNDDVEAIYMYLRTIKPIDNIVPGYIAPSS